MLVFFAKVFEHSAGFDVSEESPTRVKMLAVGVLVDVAENVAAQILVIRFDFSNEGFDCLSDECGYFCIRDEIPIFPHFLLGNENESHLARIPRARKRLGGDGDATVIEQIERQDNGKVIVLTDSGLQVAPIVEVLAVVAVIVAEFVSLVEADHLREVIPVARGFGVFIGEDFEG